MHYDPTPEQQELLKLPVIISEAAWLSAIHINDFMFDELSARLTGLIRTAYRALLDSEQAHFEQPIIFEMLQLPTTGERDCQVRLDLRLIIERKDGVPNLLRIDMNSA